MNLFKNVASQRIYVFAFDATTGLPKTGDAANITAYVGATVLGDTSATELSSSNAAGVYWFDLTQAETNYDAPVYSAKSSTANIVVIADPINIVPANFTATSIDSNGRLDIIKVAGTSQTGRDLGASVLVGDKTGFSLATSQAFNNTGTWTGNIVGTLSTLTTYTGNTPQTGDGYAVATNGTYGLAQLLRTTAYTTPPTAAANRAEMDSNSTGLAAIYARQGAPAGASQSADIAAAKADTAAIKVKTDFLPSVTAGAANGLLVAGNNAPTTFATLTVTGQTALAGLSTSGTFAVSAFTINGVAVNILSRIGST